jgi:hypothetical protein
MSDVHVIRTNFGPCVEETYLGDAVYVSHDSYQIWLRTGDGNNQRIALEPAVYRQLVAYAMRIGLDHRLERRP